MPESEVHAGCFVLVNIYGLSYPGTKVSEIWQGNGSRNLMSFRALKIPLKANACQVCFDLPSPSSIILPYSSFTRSIHMMVKVQRATYQLGAGSQADRYR